jgi:glycosyltransferase involved in cell wall biosynthesis
LKILQISASYKPAYIYGGPTMSVSRLSEELVKAGCFTDVYTTTANGSNELDVTPGKRVQVDGVDVIYFRRMTKDHTHLSPQLYLELWKNARKFDVIHIHAWWNLVSVCSALIARIKNVPVIISPRGTLSTYSFTVKNSLQKRILHQLSGKKLLNASVFHTTADAERLAIVQILQPKKIFVIPNFVQLPTLGQSPKTTPGTVIKLLFFSRIDPKKGLDLLIDALPLLKFPYHLTVAGDGDPNYIAALQQRSVDNFSKNAITWAGFQGSNKFDVLYAHDLLILPSYDENFGNVVIESLSVGTAVLISSKVGLANYVKLNQCGWICDVTPQSVSYWCNLSFKTVCRN